MPRPQLQLARRSPEGQDQTISCCSGAAYASDERGTRESHGFQEGLGLGEREESLPLVESLKPIDPCFYPSWSLSLQGFEASN